MSIKVWDGSAYIPAHLTKANVGDYPTAAHIWDGSKFIQVWPQIWIDEPFDAYGSASNWGSNFSFWSGSGGIIRNGIPYMGTLGSGSGKAAAYATATGVATQDDQYVEWIHTSASPQYSIATDSEYVIGIRANSAATQAATTAVWFVIRTGQLWISRMNSGTETNMSGVKTYTIPYGTPLRISAIGDDYRLVRMDTTLLIASWYDSTKLSARGVGQRKLQFILTGNHPSLQAQYQSPTIDNLIWRESP